MYVEYLSTYNKYKKDIHLSLLYKYPMWYYILKNLTCKMNVHTFLLCVHTYLRWVPVLTTN